MKLKDYQKCLDLTTLTTSGLTELASDIKTALCAEAEKNGGHLGSNLGVVDLTISLLKHFGEDVYYLFDTGYQSYTYKLLTDRRDVLTKLHHSDGYSVFQEMSEGDPYSGGHTSISTGWASGYKRLGEKTVIEIIGDASLATSIGLGGMLNFGSDLSTKGLFILNDNQQGIGLNKFNYLDWKKIAEGMDFAYFEVKNGHNFVELQAAWDFFEQANKNVFVKVKTIKAIGVEAPNKEFALHYFVPPTKSPTSISPIIAVCNELAILLEDKNTVVYNAGMIYNYNLRDLQKKHPKQVIDVGISEEIAIVEAAAAAQLHKKVFVLVKASFLQRTYDQLIHDVVRNHSNINLIVFGANLEKIGDSHHGLYDLNMYNMFKTVKIYQPTSLGELKATIKTTNNYQGLKVIRLDKTLTSDQTLGDIEKWKFEFNVTAPKVLITYGQSYHAWKTYIVENDLNLGLVQATSLNPIDKNLINQLLVEQKQIFTYELVMQKNNLAASIRNHFKKALITDYAFSQTNIGQGPETEILQAHNLDFQFVANDILNQHK